MLYNIALLHSLLFNLLFMESNTLRYFRITFYEQGLIVCF